jgi:hypothetical protein
MLASVVRLPACPEALMTPEKDADVLIVPREARAADRWRMGRTVPSIIL